jgi:hypothetical protein
MFQSLGPTNMVVLETEVSSKLQFFSSTKQTEIELVNSITYLFRSLHSHLETSAVRSYYWTFQMSRPSH